jgi:hypothetical protein
MLKDYHMAWCATLAQCLSSPLKCGGVLCRNDTDMCNQPDLNGGSSLSTVGWQLRSSSYMRVSQCITLLSNAFAQCRCVKNLDHIHVLVLG